MYKSLCLFGAVTVICAASAPAFAQTLNDPAQWQREHQRAVTANDPANDPDNPASSNALNKQQVERARALGDGPVAAPVHRHPHHLST